MKALLLLTFLQIFVCYGAAYANCSSDDSCNKKSGKMLNLFLGQQHQFNQGRFAGILTPEDLAPTTSRVVGAYIKDAFVGDSTTIRFFDFLTLSGHEGNSEPLTKEQWQTSSAYRKGINYYPEMTVSAAELLADIKDHEKARSLIMKRATKTQRTIGFLLGRVIGILEPLNLGAAKVY